MKFTEQIPVFGDDFDFYQTAVILSTTTIRRVENDSVVWREQKRHFTLWIPDGYDPGRTVVDEPATVAKDVTVTDTVDMGANESTVTVAEEATMADKVIDDPVQPSNNEATLKDKVLPSDKEVVELVQPSEFSRPRSEQQG